MVWSFLNERSPDEAQRNPGHQPTFRIPLRVMQATLG
jgi:hypothetical protein